MLKRIISILLTVVLIIGIIFSPLGNIFYNTAQAASTSTDISGTFTILESYGIWFGSGIVTSTGTEPFCGAKIDLDGDVNTTKTGGGNNYQTVGSNPYYQEWTYDESNKKFTYSNGVTNYTFSNADEGVRVTCMDHEIGDGNHRNSPIKNDKGNYEGKKTITYSADSKTYTISYNIILTVSGNSGKQQLRMQWSENKTVANDVFDVKLNKRVINSTGKNVTSTTSADGTQFTLYYYADKSSYGSSIGTATKTLIYEVKNNKIDFKDPSYLITGQDASAYTNPAGYIWFPVNSVIAIKETKSVSGVTINNSNWTDGTNTIPGPFYNGVGVVFRVRAVSSGSSVVAKTQVIKDSTHWGDYTDEISTDYTLTDDNQENPVEFSANKYCENLRGLKMANVMPYLYSWEGATYKLEAKTPTGTYKEVASGLSDKDGKIKWTLSTTTANLTAVGCTKKDDYTLKFDKNTYVRLTETTNDTNKPYGYYNNADLTNLLGNLSQEKQLTTSTYTMTCWLWDTTSGSSNEDRHNSPLYERVKNINIKINKLLEGDSTKSIANGDFDGAVFNLYYTQFALSNLRDGISVGEPYGTNNKQRDVNIKNELSTNTTSGTNYNYKDIIYLAATYTINNGKVTVQAYDMPLVYTPTKTASSTYSYTATNKYVDNDGNQVALADAAVFKGNVSSTGSLNEMPLGKYALIETHAPNAEGVGFSVTDINTFEFLNSTDWTDDTTLTDAGNDNDSSNDFHVQYIFTKDVNEQIEYAKVEHKLGFHKVNQYGSYISGAVIKYSSLTSIYSDKTGAISAAISNYNSTNSDYNGTFTTNTSQTGNEYGQTWSRTDAVKGTTYWRARIYHEVDIPENHDGHNNLYILALSECKASNDPVATVEYYYYKASNSFNPTNLPTNLNSWTHITANSYNNSQDGLYLFKKNSTDPIYSVYLSNTKKSKIVHQLAFHKVDEDGQFLDGATIKYSTLTGPEESIEDALSTSLSNIQGTNWSTVVTNTSQNTNPYGDIWTRDNMIEGKTYYRARIYNETEFPNNYAGVTNLYIFAVSKCVSNDNPTSTVEYYYCIRTSINDLPNNINMWTKVTATAKENAQYGLYLQGSGATLALYEKNISISGSAVHKLEIHKVDDNGNYIEGATLQYTTLTANCTSADDAVSTSVSRIKNSPNTVTTDTTQTGNAYGDIWNTSNATMGQTLWRARIYHESVPPVHYDGNTDVYILAISSCEVGSTNPTIDYYYSTNSLANLPTTLNGWTKITANSASNSQNGLYVAAGQSVNAVYIINTPKVGGFRLFKTFEDVQSSASTSSNNTLVKTFVRTYAKSLVGNTPQEKFAIYAVYDVDPVTSSSHPVRAWLLCNETSTSVLYNYYDGKWSPNHTNYMANIPEDTVLYVREMYTQSGYVFKLSYDDSDNKTVRGVVPVKIKADKCITFTINGVREDTVNTNGSLTTGSTTSSGTYNTETDVENVRKLTDNIPETVTVSATKRNENNVIDPKMNGAVLYLYYNAENEPNIQVTTTNGDLKNNIGLWNGTDYSGSATNTNLNNCSGTVLMGIFTVNAQGIAIPTTVNTISNGSSSYKGVINGETIEKLPVGYYTLVEYSAPSNGQYSVTTDIDTKEIFGNDSVKNVFSYSVENNELTATGSIKVGNEVLTNAFILSDAIRIQIPFYKSYDSVIDGTNTAKQMYEIIPRLYKREGAKFNVRLNNENGVIVATGITDANGNVTLTTTSAADTYGITLDDVDKNTLWVAIGTNLYYEEINISSTAESNGIDQSNEGYELNHEGILISYDGTQKSATISNSPVLGELSINKYLAGEEVDLSLFNGAEFEVYYTSYAGGNLKTGLQIDTNNFTRTVTIKDETSTNSTSGAGLAYSTIIHKMGTFKIQNDQIIAEAETMTFTDVNGNPTYKCTVDGDKLTDVPLGKYVIIETKAPDAINIGLSEIEYYAFETAYPKSDSYSSSNTIAATYSDSTSFQTLYNVDEDFSLRIGINEVEYIPYNLTKTYETVKDNKFYELFPERYELNDNVFKVYIRTGATSTSDHIIANGITDDNGEAVFTLTSYAIEYGYFLSEDSKTIYRPKSTTVLRSEETQSSKGYTRDTSTQTGINSTEHINTPKTVEVHLNKILIGANGSTIANAIADGKLNGAVFTLYYTPENEEYLNTNLTTNLTNSNRNQTVTIASGKTIYTVGTFTITNGKIVALASSFESHDIEYTASVNNDTNGYFYDLPLGSYALVETTAPTDITISLEEGISTHEFTDTTTTFNYTFTKSDSQITDVYITLKKESNDTSVTNNNSLYSLTNAEYSVYWNESTEVTTTVNNGVVTVGNGIYKGKFKIDSNGNGYVIENLWSDDQTVPAAYNTATQIGTTELTQFYGKPGYYVVVETKLADSGYDWDNTPRKSGLLTVDGTKMKSLTSKETPITVPVNINIVKKNIKDNTVVAQTGTQVTAQFYAGATEESELTSVTKTMVFETKSTGIIDISDSSYLKSGSLYSDNKYPAGILVLTETQAPVDYDLVGLQWEIGNTPVNKMVFRISINGNTGKVEYLDNSNAWVDVTSDVTLNYLSTTVKDKKHDYYGDFNFTKYKFQDKTGMANVSFKVVMIKDESGIDLTATEQANNTYTFVTSADGTYNSQTMNLYKNNVLVSVQEDGHKLINGTYELYEVSCDANNGYEVPSTKLDTFTINKTNTTISLGSYYNYKPEMHTVEWANDTHTHFTATSETTKIIDTVTLKDVKAGNYYLVGILVDTETKKPLTAYNSNSIITAKRAITVTADSGFDRAVEASFDVEFPTFDTRTLDGKSFTVFEYLFEADGTIAGILSTKDGVWTTENHANKTDLYLTNNNVNTYAFLSHANPGDTTQTGTLEGIIGTTVQSSKLVYAGPNQTIVDRVYYKGMDTSKRYILVAQLMGKNEDNEIVTYTTTISDIFTITNKDDIKDIEIIFDASNAKGKSFTCYEYMYQIIDDTVQNKSEFNANDTTKFYLAGHHTVFGDENQTVQVPNVWTQVTESKKVVSEVTSITDTVYYSNVIAGRTYTIRAELVDKNGNLVEITSTPISFVADSTSGSKNITFTFNSQPWAGESLVVYEYLYEGNAVDASKLIGDHTDLTDSKQTIEFTNLQMRFNKTDFNDVVLKGAKFELRDSNGTLIDSWESNGTSDHISYVTAYGKYILTEVYSPNGYALSDSIEIELRESDGKLYINGIAQDSVDTNIIDKDAALTFLPSAGGIGTIWFILSGLILMLLAVFLKKKYI